MSNVKDWALTPTGNAVAYDDSDFRDGRPRAQVKTNERAIMAAVARAKTVDTAKAYSFTGDGSTDDSTAAQASDTALVSGGGALFFTTGTYRASWSQTGRAVNLTGATRNAVIFKPSTATGVALSASYTASSWDAVTLESIGFAGAGTLQGIGHQSGGNTYASNYEYVGRTIFTNVRFYNFDKCISRPWGNIGQWVRNSQFEAANYHLYTTSYAGTPGSPMHGGNSVIEGSHFQYSNLASDYVNSSITGTGQIVRRDNIMEANAGWVHYWPTVNNGSGVPGAVIENEWNESGTNYTATSVTIGSDTSAPGWGKFGYGGGNVASLTIKNTPLGPLVLSGTSSATTNITTRDCALDNLSALTTDTNSTLMHHNARRSIGQPYGTVVSVGAVLNATGLNGPCYPMPKPRGLAPYSSAVVNVIDAQSVIAFTGTISTNSTASADPAVPFMTATQDLSIATGQTLFPSATFTIPATSWLVWQYVAKLVSGPSVGVQLTGGSGVGGSITIRDADYKTYTVISYNSGGALSSESFYHTAGASTSVVRIAGIALTSFSSAQQALEYANSGLFPANPAAAIGSPSGGTTVDTQARAAIDSIRAVLKTRGMTL